MRHVIGRNWPCRRRPLEAAGARGRSEFPRSLHRARTAAERGAGRRAPDRSSAGGRRGSAGRYRRTRGREGAARRRGWCRAAPLEGSPGFPLGGGRSETASVNARSSSLLLLRPGRDPPAAAAENAGPGVASPSAVKRAAKRPEGGERHTKSAVSGCERRRPIRDSDSRPSPLVPPGLGPRPRRQCGRARSAGARAPLAPTWQSPGSPRPLPAGPRPGRRRPLAPATGEGSRSAAAEPGNLRAGKSLRRLRGAARPAPGVRGHRR